MSTLLLKYKISAFFYFKCPLKKSFAAHLKINGQSEEETSPVVLLYFHFRWKHLGVNSSLHVKPTQ